jgi:geranylgeranyl pyrophosphate synthase
VERRYHVKGHTLPEQAFNPIRKELAEVSKAVRREVAGLSRELGTAEHPLALDGKLLRPTLALLSAKAGPGRSRGATRLATALELLHLATLAHDDLLDDADLRRGLPTIHRQLGTEAAILAGDYLFARAAVAASRLPSQTAEGFSELICTLVSGELSQLRTRLLSAGSVNEISVQQYLSTVAKKTASFTGVSCRLGARCARADATTESALASFGHNLGMAFQFLDDVSDVTGDPSDLHKPVGQDTRSGVITLPVLYALSSPGRPSWLQDLIAAFEPTEGNLTLLREACHTTRGTASSLALAGTYLDAALTCLKELPGSPAVTALALLAGSLLPVEVGDASA